MIEQRAEQELNDLHRFFEAWFTAQLDETDEQFARFSHVVSPSFTLIFPDGEFLDYQAITQRVRRAYGIKKDNPRYYRIWLDNVRCRFKTDKLGLFTYEEWHEDNGSISARLSTVLLQEKQSEHHPNGLEWIHVHEVWLPGQETHVKRVLLKE